MSRSRVTMKTGEALAQESPGGEVGGLASARLQHEVQRLRGPYFSCPGRVRRYLWARLVAGSNVEAWKRSQGEEEDFAPSAEWRLEHTGIATEGVRWEWWVTERLMGWRREWVGFPELETVLGSRSVLVRRALEQLRIEQLTMTAFDVLEEGMKDKRERGAAARMVLQAAGHLQGGGDKGRPDEGEAGKGEAVKGKGTTIRVLQGPAGTGVEVTT